jgi:hypothetical protein
MGSAMIPGLNNRYYPVNLQQRLFPPNMFDACLCDETRLWQEIQRCGGLQALCPGHKYKEPPWVKMPPQGKRFLKPNSIALPDPDGIDHVVTTIRVPMGYDGVIVSTINLYTGQNFAEGSGDLTWRIKINQHYAKDYGAILTTIGSMQTPYNINSGGIILQSNQLVQFIVNRSTASAGNLNGGRIICTFAGWFWPR